MKTRYIDLIKQTFEFPQESFDVIDDSLHFNGIPLMDIIDQYGTPVKITYLPKISSQIQKAKRIFNVAMARADYKGKYTYCYCTKSSHFSFVLEEALKNEIHLETSSGFDIPIIRNLHQQGLINKDIFILCNGFKRPAYVSGILELANQGFSNLIPILDNVNELTHYEKGLRKKLKIGIRIASDEEPNFDFYTSRLGIRPKEIIDYYKANIRKNNKIELKLLHFFINTGIKNHPITHQKHLYFQL